MDPTKCNISDPCNPPHPSVLVPTLRARAETNHRDVSEAEADDQYINIFLPEPKWVDKLLIYWHREFPSAYEVKAFDSCNDQRVTLFQLESTPGGSGNPGSDYGGDGKYDVIKFPYPVKTDAIQLKLNDRNESFSDVGGYSPFFIKVLLEDFWFKFKDCYEPELPVRPL
jgi:hypothetical protein